MPNTDATSGKLLIMRSEVCSSSAALVTDMPGTLTGLADTALYASFVPERLAA